MGLSVLSAGFYTTVQDLGRYGYQRYGVSPAGAMDWLSLRIANQVVGNPVECAGLEFTLDMPALLAEDDLLVAAAGKGFDLFVQGRPMSLWMACFVRRGEVIHFQARDGGGWGYLAVGGGIDTPPVMGSRSTDVRARLGGVEGRVLRDGDVLPVGSPPVAGLLSLAGRSLKKDLRPDYSAPVILPVVLGPQEDAFLQEGIQTLFNSPYTIAHTSDRTGYRLNGPAIAHRGSADLLSEGMALGSVQVPADGQPIVMMSDHPTTGGYPKIATAARVGLPSLAQQTIGNGMVRFREVTVAQAQQDYRRLIAELERGIDDGDD